MSLSEGPSTVRLTVDSFGQVADPKSGTSETVQRYTWTNASGMSVQAITYGATVTSIKVPDKYGVCDDVALGFDDMAGYQQKDNPYFGATVGRCINRIAKGEFKLNGKCYQLNKNWNNRHHLHGGYVGFDKFNWTGHVDGATAVVMTHVSEDGWENYPGTVMACVRMDMDDENNFHITITATSDAPTPINLGNHSYFNLAGHAAGHEELYKHVVTLNADRYTITDADSIPTGKLGCVGGTVFDLRIPRELGQAMALTERRGYDDNFCVTKASDQTLAFVARALHPTSGRVLEVYSDQIGVQFYTSNGMPDPDGDINPPEVYTQDFYNVPGDLTKLEPIKTSVKSLAKRTSGESPHHISGKGGAHYQRHSSFCLETQKYPDSVNHSEFPSVILNPGETYHHKMVFKFSVHAD